MSIHIYLQHMTSKPQLRLFGFSLFFLYFFLNKPLTVYSQEILSTKNIELLRVGQQLNITMQFESVPAYEEHENLSEKVLLIKFKNTRLDLNGGNQDLLYNDPILEGLRFTQEENEVWDIHLPGFPP